MLQIEKRINLIRRDIAHLQIFFKHQERSGRKVIRNIQNICYQFGVNLCTQNAQRKLRQHEEYLKQRVAALGARIRRYNEAAKRRQDERLFEKNQKLFFRKLEVQEVKQLSTKLPSEQEAFNFWSNIWSDDVNYNENASWLEEIENNTLNVPEMPSCIVTLEKITNTIKKTNNWKAPASWT